MLVHMHSAVASRIADVALEHFGYPAPHPLTGEKSLGRIIRAGSSSQNEDDRARMFYFLREIARCRDVLARNGIIDIAPDGGSGSTPGIDFQLHGITRNFKTSFAQLAVATGAAAIPVLVSLGESGVVHVRFESAFNMGSEDLERGARIHALAHAYTTLYGESWAREPWNISWRRVRKHLRAIKHQYGVEAVYPPSGHRAQRVRRMIRG